jgi:hypothetical protein
MWSRAIAGLLVIVLIGPSVVTATCELTCAIGRHHHSTPSSSAASCHEHQGATDGVGVGAKPLSLCHESGGLPSAVVDAWLNAVLVTAIPASEVVIAPPIATRTTAPAHARRAPFDPRPAHRPLRV